MGKDKLDEKRILILNILNEAESPLSSKVVCEHLEHRGTHLSERTVRFHMLALDKLGLTEYIEKKGRIITPFGHQQIEEKKVFQRVGYLSSYIDEAIYKMDFDLARKKGTLLINLSIIPLEKSATIFYLMAPIFESKLSCGQKLALFLEGEQVGESRIPYGHFGLGTICSFTFNGILFQKGIPIHSLFGGLLALSGRMPTHFKQIIKYSGTTLDPLEIFINSGMSDVKGAAESGAGFIGGSFREIPSAALEQTLAIHNELEEIGLGSLLAHGYAGHPLLGIPVGEGRAGLITAGGLNAVAALVESGVPTQSESLSALVDYSRLISYKELRQALTRLI